jgi:hypothetical protein
MRQSSRVKTRRGLFGILPVIAAMATQAISASQMETAEIITDLDQMDQLLNSLQDIKKGQLMPITAAFSDL